jgi:hypothetical protein
MRGAQATALNLQSKLKLADELLVHFAGAPREAQALE